MQTTPTHRPLPPSRPRLAVALAALVLANIACAATALHLTSRQAHLKRDYAHVNSVRHGLFSMSVWKGHFENIVSRSITKLKFSPKDEAAFKAEIEKVVRLLITQADHVLTRNRQSLGGKVRKVAYQALVDVPALMKRSPQFAETVVKEMTKPSSLEQLRILALNQLNKYAADTRNNDTDGPPLEHVLQKYQAKNITEFNAVATPEIQRLHRQLRTAISCMMASVVLVLAVWWFLRNEKHLHATLFVWSTALAGVILATSLSVPMIDIDARIKTVDLLLLGENIQFTNQILYYRSKSILEVVRILIVSSRAGTVMVGVLILLFSVVFPIAKLASTMITLWGRARYRNNRWVEFFAYHSGKWAMADVMVVAIFMAYIGFNSILSDQLADMNATSESWQMITTNQTALQPGFYLFMTFVLFGLALSEILKKIVAQSEPFSERRQTPHYYPLPKIREPVVPLTLRF